MKNFKLSFTIILIFGIIVLILSIGDFLSLQDIKQDYVSHEVLNSQNMDLSKELPNWTSTKSEWSFVIISFWTRLVFLVLFSVVIFSFIKKQSIKS